MSEKFAGEITIVGPHPVLIAVFPERNINAGTANKDYLLLLPAILPAGKTLDMSNITQVVNTDKFLKTLKKGVHASDLDQLLSSTGPFTFFAPTDLAFEKMDKAQLVSLLEPKNKVVLTDLLHSHIVNGKILYRELKDGDKLTTLNGKELAVVVKNGEVSVDGINVLARDAKISNGAIHSTDTVFQKK